VVSHEELPMSFQMKVRNGQIVNCRMEPRPAPLGPQSKLILRECRVHNVTTGQFVMRVHQYHLKGTSSLFAWSSMQYVYVYVYVYVHVYVVYMYMCSNAKGRLTVSMPLFPNMTNKQTGKQLSHCHAFVFSHVQDKDLGEAMMGLTAQADENNCYRHLLNAKASEISLGLLCDERSMPEPCNEEDISMNEELNSVAETLSSLGSVPVRPTPPKMMSQQAGPRGTNGFDAQNMQQHQQQQGAGIWGAGSLGGLPHVLPNQRVGGAGYAGPPKADRTGAVPRQSNEPPLGSQHLNQYAEYLQQQQQYQQHQQRVEQEHQQYQQQQQQQQQYQRQHDQEHQSYNGPPSVAAFTHPSGTTGSISTFPVSAASMLDGSIGSNPWGMKDDQSRPPNRGPAPEPGRSWDDMSQTSASARQHTENNSPSSSASTSESQESQARAILEKSGGWQPTKTLNEMLQVFHTNLKDSLPLREVNESGVAPFRFAVNLGSDPGGVVGDPANSKSQAKTNLHSKVVNYFRDVALTTPDAITRLVNDLKARGGE
jgi:hypothetical protein